MVDRMDEEAASLNASILPGPRLIVIGSTSFWSADSLQLCKLIAGELAAIVPLVALTGGMDGVGITFGRSFAAARTRASLPDNLFHLLPRGMGPCDCGVTLGAGIDFHERREILGRLGDVCLVIEGGPGTEHEATVALSRETLIIPFGRSGGYAGDLHSKLSCPRWAREADWALLGNTDAPYADVVLAVRRLVEAAINISDKPSQRRER
jgi:hypothetical protein